ncbi:High mobility group protein DSP1 [Orchesella cincta]|uniref:High mobility group protein DSP1 n=1 Tax=Orchesella cincta TaxID=48709 RepID=A0A1D2M855_ORCCI|nr:High mobility group protein DSP1 [Orchesella cincta]
MSGPRGAAGSRKPKGPVSAYDYFLRGKREDIKRGAGAKVIPYKEHRKICAEIWKNMSQEEKKPFELMHLKDIKRHKKQMRKYIPPTGTIAGKKRIKRPVTAYMFFVKNRWEELKNGGNWMPSFGAHSKKCSELWKGMSVAQKKPYTDQAERDKKRHEREMKGYVPPPKGVGQEGAKKWKDPNAPKRGLSAFFWYSSEHRAAVQAANPWYGNGKVSKELGRMWREMTPAAKAKYQRMADRDRARYDRDMEAYKKRSVSQAAGVAEEGEEEQEEEEEDDDEVD